MGVAHGRVRLETAPQNSERGTELRGTRQFVTAPREADETSSAYLAITPDA